MFLQIQYDVRLVGGFLWFKCTLLRWFLLNLPEGGLQLIVSLFAADCGNKLDIVSA